MRILVACEESQTVCKAFRARGHEAYSADIQEPSGGHPEWHILGDVLPLINGYCAFTTMDGKLHRIDDTWDLLIAHPPCTFLTKAGGNRITIKGVRNEERYQEGLKAKAFFMALYTCNAKRICIENPIPLKMFGLPPYTQIIQPYMFGDEWMKTTCLWLIRLPPLFATDIVVPEYKLVNCSDHRKKKRPDTWQTGGARSAKARSKTAPGIGRAMSEQWGGLAT